MRLTIAIVFGVVLSVFLVAQIIAHYTKHPIPSIVSFNPQKVQAQLVRRLALLHASKEQVTKTSLQFKSLLHKSLNEYSKKHQVLIVDSQLLLAGGTDITEVMFKELTRMMRKAV